MKKYIVCSVCLLIGLNVFAQSTISSRSILKQILGVDISLNDSYDTLYRLDASLNELIANVE